MRKRLFLTSALLVIACLGLLLVTYIDIQNVFWNKLSARREIREEKSRGAIVLKKGSSEIVNDTLVSFDVFPVTGQLVFTVHGETVTASDGDFIVINTETYQVHGWGIGEDAWASLLPTKR
jgi:hypothetical protein